MQSEILKAYPQARLRVYAIWVSKVFGDARHRWDAAGLTDPRVVHLWDAKDVSGAWLAGNVQGYQPRPTWNIGGPSGRARSTSTEAGGRSSGAAVRRG